MDQHQKIPNGPKAQKGAQCASKPEREDKHNEVDVPNPIYGRVLETRLRPLSKELERKSTGEEPQAVTSQTAASRLSQVEVDRDSGA